MRLVFIMLLMLIPTPAIAGFSVTYSSSESSSIYLAAVESRAATLSAMTPKELEASLAHRAAKLSKNYSEIINGALSLLSADLSIQPIIVSAIRSNMHFTLTAPVTNQTLSPDDLRLDVFLDINGVDLGGLASVTGVPSGNGRQGIVRIDGMTGKQLVHYLAPRPHIPLLSQSGPVREDLQVTVAEEFACLLFILAAFLSALRQQQQQQEQQRLLRRRRKMLAREALALRSASNLASSSLSKERLPSGQVQTLA